MAAHITHAHVTHGCEPPYGPGDNPYEHWARCMVAPDGPQDGSQPSDGRRLRRRAREGETWAVPLVVRLADAPGSSERRGGARGAERPGGARRSAHGRA